MNGGDGGGRRKDVVAGEAAARTVSKAAEDSSASSNQRNADSTDGGHGGTTVGRGGEKQTVIDELLGRSIGKNFKKAPPALKVAHERMPLVSRRDPTGHPGNEVEDGKGLPQVRGVTDGSNQVIAASGDSRTNGPVATPARGGEDGEGAGPRSAQTVAASAKGGDRAGLAAREVPRQGTEGETARSRNSEGERGVDGDKHDSKGAIRGTLIRRAGSSRDADASGSRGRGGNGDSPTHDGRMQNVSETTQKRESPNGGGDLRFAADGLRTEAGRPGASTLEGGRDVAPRHLQQQLKDFATGDVVRHARFVVKENSGGEIRLLLRPKELGTVRVRLEVQDNRIAGRIIVENTTVREAFEQTLPELQRAFREAGLDTGSLEVSVGDHGEKAGEQHGGNAQRGRAIEELAESVPDVEGSFDEPRMLNVYA